MTRYRRSNTDESVQAGDLDDACWEDYEAVGLKPGAGGKMVPNCVPVKSAGGLSERDENAEFEALAGGPEKAFRMMRLWERAEQAASGNRYTLGEQVDPVAVFVSAARRDRFSDKAIQYYVEEIQGSRLPKKWKALRASVPVKSAAWKVAAKRTTHLEGKSGYTSCGERAHDDTLVESVKDATCHYCKQAWEKQH